MSPNETEHSPELRRKIFLALVTAQDQEMSVERSRREIAQSFGITEAEVVRIEREGLDNNWPPL
jgi:DNA-directed RNA polymerase specialized sigma subunit